MKRIESLLKITDIKSEFYNLEIHFHKRQVSRLVVKTVKCKRGIRCKTVQVVSQILQCMTAGVARRILFPFYVAQVRIQKKAVTATVATKTGLFTANETGKSQFLCRN